MSRRYICTFEWDEEVGRDEHNDPIFKRHICVKTRRHKTQHQSQYGKKHKQVITKQSEKEK